MTPCHFLTWNLGGRRRKEGRERARRALELVVDHLIGQGTCVAALQEVCLPDGVLVEDVILEKSGGRIAALEQTLGTKVLLLHSRDLLPRDVHRYSASLDNEPGGERLVGATFGADVSWGGLQVLGVHLRDRGTSPEGQGRGVDSAGWQRDFLEFWKGGPLVVLGDFNADPYEPEVCARSGGFFALRDRETLWKSPRWVDKTPRLPLFNPMWQHLREKRWPEPRGTFAYDDEKRGIRSWIYDQILLGGSGFELLDGLVEGPLVHGKLGESWLITKQDGRSAGGYPSPSLWDHLPVSVLVDMEKVGSCRI